MSDEFKGDSVRDRLETRWLGFLLVFTMAAVVVGGCALLRNPTEEGGSSLVLRIDWESVDQGLQRLPALIENYAELHRQLGAVWGDKDMPDAEKETEVERIGRELTSVATQIRAVSDALGIETSLPSDDVTTVPPGS